MTNQDAFKRSCAFHFALLDDSLSGEKLIELVDKWVEEEEAAEMELLVWEPFEGYPREDVRAFIWNLAGEFQYVYKLGILRAESKA